MPEESKFIFQPHQLQLEGFAEASGEAWEVTAGDAFGRLICYAVADTLLRLSRVTAETGQTWQRRDSDELRTMAATAVRRGEIGLQG